MSEGGRKVGRRAGRRSWCGRGDRVEGELDWDRCERWGRFGEDVREERSERRCSRHCCLLARVLARFPALDLAGISSSSY